MEIRQRIEGYLELLEELREVTGDEQAALVILAEMGKDRRSEAIRAERVGSKESAEDDDRATEKQIAFLARLGVSREDAEALGRREASTRIDELKAA